MVYSKKLIFLFIILLGISFFSFSAWAKISSGNNLPTVEMVQPAIGIPDEVVEELMNAANGIRQFFIQIQSAQLTLTPDDSFTSSEAVASKLKGSLLDEINQTTSQTIRVNVMVLSNSLPIVESHASTLQGTIKNRFSVGNILSIEIPSDKLIELAQISQVKSIWPDRIFRTNLDSSVPQIHAPDLWAEGYTGTGMKVAVLDTGIDAAHPMLSGRVPVSQSFTGESPNDVLGHGTHVAGIIGGKLNGANTYNGVAPDSTLWNLKVLDNTGHGSESWIIAGINYAVDPDNNPATDDGVDIINMSFGGPYTDPNSPIVAAVEATIQQGVVVVIASGNCGPGCPSGDCQGFVGVETPGDSLNAITVGAVDDASQWACFSSGGFVNNGLTLKPDVVAPGVNISSSSLNSSIATLSGTSMAAPHVSGMVALLLQSSPSISPQNVKDILEQTASDFGDPGKDSKYGSGLIDASQLLPSSVLTFLKYKLFLSANVVDKGLPVSFTITSSAADVQSITLDVNAPNQFITSVPLTQNGLQWNGSFSSTTQVGTFLVTATITNIANDVTVLKKSFAVRTPSTTGNLVSHDLPAQTNYGQPIVVNVQFQNTGSYDTDVLVELQEWKDDYFERIHFSNATPVSAGQTVFIPVNWAPETSVGLKTIKLVATFDDTALELDQNVFVEDPDAPVIWNISVLPAATDAQPILVDVRAGDLTPLSGTIHVTSPWAQDIPLFTRFDSDFNRSLRGIIEPQQVGNVSFTVELCDSASSSHCVTSVQQWATVSACVLPKSLIVLGSGQPSDFNFLSTSLYCLGFWEDVRQTPSLNFLETFPLVYWYAGSSYAGAVDENAAVVLLDYTGSVVLEGDDIGQRHGNDDFLRTIGHATFQDGLSPQDLNGVFVMPWIEHYLFKATQFPYSLSGTAISPDVFTPTNNGKSFARYWMGSGLGYSGDAIVGYQNGFIRHLLVGFNTKALIPSKREALVSKIFKWMFLNTGFDLTITAADSFFDPDHIFFSDPNPRPGPVVEPIPLTYLREGQPNPIHFSVKNVGDQTSPSVAVSLSDGFLPIAQFNLPTILPNRSKALQFDEWLYAGDYNIYITPNPNALNQEPNTLNNSKRIPVWVAPLAPNAVPTKIIGSHDGNQLTIHTYVTNLGGTAINNLSVNLNVNGVTTPYQISAPPGETALNTFTFSIPKENTDVSVTVDPNNSLAEADEGDNFRSERLYFCTKSPILIVDDDDAQIYWASDEDFDGDPTDWNASSALLFEKLLKDKGYCTAVWNESTQGVPDANILNQFLLIIWSTGDYWSQVVDSNDEASIRQYSGSILFEGNDIAFDHRDDNFSIDILRADMNRDVFSLSGMEQITLNNSIFPALPSLDINFFFSSFADAVTPINGSFSAGDWNAGESALTLYSSPGRRTSFMSFAFDSISSLSDQNTFLISLVDWLLLASNQSPSAPTSLSCNGAVCSGNYANSISLACSGSTDPESDAITYSLEAALSSSSAPPGWWDANWSNRQELSILHSGNTLSDFTIRLDLNAQTSDASFWAAVNASGSDIRFIANNQSLPYFIELFNAGGPKAIIHVRVPTLNAGNNSIYLYWNNPSASIFSDFNSISRVAIHDGTDLAGWSQYKDNGNYWVVNSGYFYNDSITGTQYLAKPATGLYDKTRVAWFKTRMQSNASNDMEMRFYPYSDFTNYPDDVIVQLRPGFLDLWLDDGQAYFCGSAATTPATMHELFGSRGTDNVWRIYNDGVKILECADSTTKTAPFNSMHSHAGNVQGYVDYAYHRITTPQEPTAAFGAIETSSSGSGTWQSIGTHAHGSAYAWNISTLGIQSNVGLRCRAIDYAGSGQFSPYYMNDQNISIN